MSTFAISHGRAVFSPKFNPQSPPSVDAYRQGVADQAQLNNLMDYFQALTHNVCAHEGTSCDLNQESNVTAIVDEPSALPNAPGLISGVIIQGKEPIQEDLFSHSPEEYLLAKYAHVEVQRIHGQVDERLTLQPSDGGVLITQTDRDEATGTVYKSSLFIDGADKSLNFDAHSWHVN